MAVVLSHIDPGRLINEEEQEPVPTKRVLSQGKEYYRFAHHFIASFILVFLIVWSLLPLGLGAGSEHGSEDTPMSDYQRFVAKLIGVLPQQRWVITGQALGLMAMLFAYIGLQLYDEDVLAVAPADFRAIVDDRSELATPPTRRELLQKYAFSETSAVVDIPIMDVCNVLYSEHVEEHDQ